MWTLKRFKTVSLFILFSFIVFAAAIPLTPVSAMTIIQAMEPSEAAVKIEKEITAEIPGLPLNLTIDKLAKLAGVPCLINGSLEGLVLMRFENLTFAKIMDTLATGYNFSWILRNGVVIVTSNDAMKTEARTFLIKHTDLAAAKNKLKTFVTEDKIAINPQESSIVVDANPMVLEKARKILAEMDIPVRQVMIQAQLVSIDRSKTTQIGPEFTWNNYTSGGGWSFKWATTFNAQEVVDRGRVISRPKVATFNGQTAIVEMVDRVPVLQTTVASDGTKTTTVNYEDIGTKLEVTPRVIEENGKVQIAMSVKPTYSTFTGWVESEGTKAPQISSRKAETNVRINSGETFVISGMIKAEDFKTVTKIPGFSKLPIIGKLFQFHNSNKSETEIFIFVTPILLDDSSQDVPDKFKEYLKPSLPAGDAVPENNISKKET